MIIQASRDSGVKFSSLKRGQPFWKDNGTLWMRTTIHGIYSDRVNAVNLATGALDYIKDSQLVVVAHEIVVTSKDPKQ